MRTTLVHALVTPPRQLLQCEHNAVAGPYSALLRRMTDIAARAYAAAPVWMQNLMISAYGARLRRMRYGPEQRRNLAHIRGASWAPPNGQRAVQLAELNRVLSHARQTVPFHLTRIPPRPLVSLEQLTDVPLMTKTEVRLSGRELISRQFGNEKLLEVHTGGTTGTPLTIYCDRHSLRRNYAFFARFLESAGIPANARVATFAGRVIVPPGTEGPPFWRYNVAGRAMLCSSYHIGEDSVAAYANALARFRPAFIDSYPSSILPIARYLLRTGDDRIRPRAVVTSSETLLAADRTAIADAFGCPVFDHYGAAEMAAFITQCAAGEYHPNADYGIVEVLRNGVPVAPGETGQLVATGFINPVMPLIRYVTGDLAVRGSDEPCRCGSPFPRLSRIIGREDDVLITPEGNRIGRLDPIFKTVSSLSETRIVQDTTSHVRVELVSARPLEPSEEESLRSGLRNRLGPSMTIDFVRVPRLERTAGGKLRSVVNLTASRS